MKYDTTVACFEMEFPHVLLATRMMFDLALMDEMAALKQCKTAIRHSLRRMSVIFIAVMNVRKSLNKREYNLE